MSITTTRHNKNCLFSKGILRIEIPIKPKKSSSISKTNNMPPSPKLTNLKATSTSSSSSASSMSKRSKSATANNNHNNNNNNNRQQVFITNNTETNLNNNPNQQNSNKFKSTQNLNSSSTAANNNSNDTDKYLELVFDLYDFKFERIDVRESKEEARNKLLVVRAYKAEGNAFRPYLRKYILPEWVDTEKMIVTEEKQVVDGQLKNVLVVQIGIAD